jgi:transposase
LKSSWKLYPPWKGVDEGRSRTIGRKRHLGCDTLGLLLTVLVTAASVSDTAAGVTLLSRIAAAHPHITKAWGGRGLRTTAIDHGARLDIDVHPVHRPPGTRVIVPRRWSIARSIGWLMHHRHLARDYETHPHRSEAVIHLAMTDLMAPANSQAKPPRTGAEPDPDQTQIHGPKAQ